MPSLDQQVMPQLTPSKSFASPPSPSSVPPVASVSGTDVPSNVPDVSSDTTPLQPPSLRDTLPSAPVLQETTGTHAATIPGNHLTLDPTVSTVLFSRGSGNIDDTVLTTLDKLSAILNANPDVRVTLTAYADNTDSTPRDARRLSLARALAVRDYLGSRGISDSRIDVRAEGANTTSGYIDRVDVKVND
jgi:outer membrane protein OmpA-like peptidoglycan-associated protein